MNCYINKEERNATNSVKKRWPKTTFKSNLEPTFFKVKLNETCWWKRDQYRRK